MSEADDAWAWKVLPVPPPGEGASVAFELDGLALLLCRADGALYALRNLCPHARVPLTGAALRGCILECPLHGGELDVRDGSPVTHPIRRAAITHPVREREGRIEVGLLQTH